MNVVRIDPFTIDQLNWLLESDSSRPTLLKRRESKTLEFKANFSLSDDAKVDYARTMAAFANRDGGYLMFGIRDSPHVKDGMRSTKMEMLDPKGISQFLQNHFSPNIDWQHHVHFDDGLAFGFIYVAPALRKPIVCVAANSKGKTMRDGDIYYRYPGETRLIGSGELHGIINERVENERRSWQELLKRTAQINPPNVAYLDLDSGRLSGSEGSLMIGQDVLEKVKFIQEGKFGEQGEPTLRVLGDVEVVRTEAIPYNRAVPVDPSARCTLWEKEAMQQIIEFTGEAIVWSDETQRRMTDSLFRDVVKAYGIESPSPMLFIPQKSGSRKQYGQCLVDWILERYQKDSTFFLEASQHARTRGHKAVGAFKTPPEGVRDVEPDDF